MSRWLCCTLKEETLQKPNTKTRQHNATEMHVVQIHKSKVLAILAVVCLITCLVIVSLSSRTENTTRVIESTKIRLARAETTARVLQHKTNKRITKFKTMKSIQKKNGQSYKYINSLVSSADLLKGTGTNKRVFILTFGGNELSHVLDDLNRRDDVIYWHEPMKILERIAEKWRGNDLVVHEDDPFKTFQLQNSDNTYQSSLEFFNELFSCEFSLKIVGFLKTAVKRCPHYLSESSFLRELLECNQTKYTWTCRDVTNSVVTKINKICRDRKFNVVVKDNDERLVAMEHLHKQIEGSFNILHLVRDPRSVIYEFSLQGRVERNPNYQEVWDKVSYACNCLVNNLKYGKQLVNSYNLYRYEDFQSHVEFSKMLGLKSHKPKTTLTKTLKHGWWRAEINPDFSSTVENICYAAVDELGYVFLDQEVRGNAMSFRKT